MLKQPPHIPLTLITGFLGAGKTTLLNAMLKDEALAQSVVLMNEFGEVGLDHLLMEGVEDGMILLESGCLCCTIRGELITTLEDLLRRRDNGRMAPFKRLIIETTGLADPAPILNVLIAHPYLAMRYQIDGVVTVVDAINGMATLDTHREALRQVVVADLVVLAKADLAEAGTVQRLRRRLGELNPGVSILDASQDVVTAQQLIGLGRFDLDRKPRDVREWLAADAATRPLANAHDHDAECDHDNAASGTRPAPRPAQGDETQAQDDGLSAQDHPLWNSSRQVRHQHDLNRHDKNIRAFVLTAENPVRMATFDLFWTLLRSTHGPKLLRLKGLVCVAEHPDQPLVVHGVQAVLHPPVLLERWPDSNHGSRLVLIVDDLDPALVERLWAAFLGQPSAG